jgi:hypothetical protein
MAQPRGTFFILSHDRPNSAISVPKGSKEAGTMIIEEEFTGGSKQQWIIEDGLVRNVKSGLFWTNSRRGLHQDFYQRTNAGQRFLFGDYISSVQSHAMAGHWQETTSRFRQYNNLLSLAGLRVALV